MKVRPLAPNEEQVAPAAAQRLAGYAPTVKASWLTDQFDKAGKWLDEKIGQPVTQAVKTVKQATGLEAKPIPDSVKPVIDQNKSAADAAYGQKVTQGAAQYDPAKYGPDYWKARQFNPQITTPGVAMPGQQQFQQVKYAQPMPQRPNEGAAAQELAGYAQRQPSAVQTEGQVGAPELQKPSSAGLPVMQRQQPGQLKFQSEGEHLAPQRAAEGNFAQPGQTNEASRSMGTRSPESGFQSPAMNQETGQPGMGLQQVQGINPNVQPYQQAITQEMNRLQTPQQMQAGFDPASRQKAIELATSGIDMAKDRALRQMQEQQMASGNFGSSVGQREMAELAMQYDQQRQNAESQIDLRNMEAEREDRYRNVDVDLARSGQIGNLAGSGYNMGMGSAGFEREGVTMDNQAKQIQEQYAREGRQIDNATAMQLAQYGREGRQIDTNASQREAQFGREGTMIDQSTSERLAQFGREGRNIDYTTAMQGAQFGREGRAMDNASGVVSAQFDREGTQMNNQIEQTIQALKQQGIQLDNATEMQIADYLRQGRSMDLGREEAQGTADYNRALQLAQYGREGRGLDYDRDMAQDATGYNRTMDQAGFNRQSEAMNTDQDWRRYQASTDEARYGDQLTNAGSQFNIGQQDARDLREYQGYNDALSRLAGYGQPGVTPESQLAYQQWMAQQQDQQARFGATLTAAGQLIKK